jgi:hypothetical protein
MTLIELSLEERKAIRYCVVEQLKNQDYTDGDGYLLEWARPIFKILDKMVVVEMAHSQHQSDIKDGEK